MWRKVVVLTMVITASLSVGISRALAVEFHSEVENTTLLWEATANQNFATNAGEISCTGFIASGTVIGTKGFAMATAGGTPSGYTGCKAFGLVEVENSASECEYVLSAAAETLTIQESPVGNCVANPLTFTVLGGIFGNCKVTYAPQTAGAVAYKNLGAGATRSIEVNFAVAGLKYATTGGLCGAGGANGTYTGTVVLRGREFGGAKQVGIWIE